MFYAYNAFLRFSGMYRTKAECPDDMELTSQEPPSTPWPEGMWPYFIDDRWELVEVQQRLAG